MTAQATPHFSIGEVLNVLKDDYPNVTVSKIRFLESEGLIAPERTESGYRKFSPNDVDRLRFILKLQRDQFLPLKVIRERLDEADISGQVSLLDLADEEPAPTDARAEMLRSGTGASLSEDELAAASGLTGEQIRELAGARLLTPAKLRDEGDGADVLRFNEDDLESAKLCRALLDLGLEPRHLRTFRLGADRMIDLAQQMSAPILRQRNPASRKAATEKVRELVRVGNKLSRLLLRSDLDLDAPGA